MARITAFAAQKGGTGKTTITTNVAATLAGPSYERQVLVLDLDAQCHATEAILQERPTQNTLADVIRQSVTVEEAIVRSSHPGADGRLWCLPGDMGLFRELEAQLMSAEKFDVASFCLGLAEQMEEAIGAWRDPETGRPFDHVLIDTPPALGIWTRFAMTLADGVACVGTADRRGYDGVLEASQFMMDTRPMNPKLVLDAVIVNLWKVTRSDPKLFLVHYEEGFRDFLITPPLPDLSQIAAGTERMTPVEFLRLPGARNAALLFHSVVEQLIGRWAPAASETDAFQEVLADAGAALAARLPDAATAAALANQTVPRLDEADTPVAEPVADHAA